MHMRRVGHSQNYVLIYRELIQFEKLKSYAFTVFRVLFLFRVTVSSSAEGDRGLFPKFCKIIFSGQRMINRIEVSGRCR